MINHKREKTQTDLAAKVKPFTMIMSSGKDRLGDLALKAHRFKNKGPVGLKHVQF